MQDHKGADVSAVISQVLPCSLKAPAGVTGKAYRLLVVTLLLRPFGNLSLAWGMRHFSEALSVYPLVYLRALLNPFVALGIGMLILALLTRMALLSVADLSFVLPLTATGYVFSALLGKMFLNEQVSAGRWAGTLFIFLGIALVGSTPVRSTEGSNNASFK
jgi:drug/metabolite transporter (DMT)-like permease